MRLSRTILGVFLVMGVTWVGYMFFTSQQENAEFAELSRKDSKRKVDDQANSAASMSRLYAELWKERKGRRVPDDLSVRRVEDYFFVGKRGENVGVEIPFPPGTVPNPPPNDLESVRPKEGYLGASSCKDCHRKQFESFIQTAHHLTSRKSDLGSIQGSFESGSNELTTGNSGVHFEMLERDGRCFQRVSFFDWGFEVPFDITFGSAKMAQTFLYWNETRLYQMNVTYLASEDAWINSPGFIDGDAAYARPIPAGCIECHATYADYRAAPNSFTPESIVFGISCERCHGPGAEHVDYHKANPNLEDGKFMTVPSKLPRERELAICSQCHAGVNKRHTESFTFRPGDAFTDHFDEPTEDSGNGVHTSNQLLRLSKSECFKQTEMTCIDCHNPHRLERGDTKLFSQRCIECHEIDQCGLHDEWGDKLAENCIDCHMPKRAGDHLRLDTKEKSIFPELRDHYIRVDAEATKLMLQGTMFKD